MADITYTPQFQPPGWRDNVDFVSAEGPGGFNAQFQSLQAELVKLSNIVKNLSDAILSANQTLQANNSAAQTLQTTTRVIQAVRWGEIKVDGTIASGSGNFTVTKAGTGLYDIIFNPAFTAIPVIQATQMGQQPLPASTNTIPSTYFAGDTRDNMVVIGVTMSQCRVKTGGSSGSASDRSFSFLVYGPST